MDAADTVDDPEWRAKRLILARAPTTNLVQEMGDEGWRIGQQSGPYAMPIPFMRRQVSGREVERYVHD